MKTNNYIIGASLLVLVSCVGSNSSPKKKALSVSPNSSVSTSTSPTKSFIVDESPVVLKTFNQYNATLSKVTGIDSAETDISDEYEKIKNSLPGEHSANAFTPFHQISQTRLAFTYCKNFVDNDSVFKAYNYGSLNSKVLTKNLLDKFMGSKEIIGEEAYVKFENVLLKIMNNDAGLDDNGVAIGKLLPVATGATLNKNFTKLGCTALLASSEFTTI